MQDLAEYRKKHHEAYLRRRENPETTNSETAESEPPILPSRPSAVDPASVPQVPSAGAKTAQPISSSASQPPHVPTKASKDSSSKPRLSAADEEEFRRQQLLADEALAKMLAEEEAAGSDYIPVGGNSPSQQNPQHVLSDMELAKQLQDEEDRKANEAAIATASGDDAGGGVRAPDAIFRDRLIDYDRDGYIPYSGPNSLPSQVRQSASETAPVSASQPPVRNVRHFTAGGAFHTSNASEVLPQNRPLSPSAPMPTAASSNVYNNSANNINSETLPNVMNRSNPLMSVDRRGWGTSEVTSSPSIVSSDYSSPASGPSSPVAINPRQSNIAGSFAGGANSNFLIPQNNDQNSSSARYNVSGNTFSHPKSQYVPSTIRGPTGPTAPSVSPAFQRRPVATTNNVMNTSVISDMSYPMQNIPPAHPPVHGISSPPQTRSVPFNQNSVPQRFQNVGISPEGQFNQQTLSQLSRAARATGNGVCRPVPSNYCSASSTPAVQPTSAPMNMVVPGSPEEEQAMLEAAIRASMQQ